MDSQESLFKSGAQGSARPGARAAPPSPCGAGPPGRPCSGAAPAASRRAAGGRPPACTPRRSTARGSGTAPSAGPTGCTHTRAPHGTRTSWGGFLTRKENENLMNNSQWEEDAWSGGAAWGMMVARDLLHNSLSLQLQCYKFRWVACRVHRVRGQTEI